MRYLLFISRILTGILFIYSGFVKAVDPAGSMYKFTDYFSAFGLESFGAVAFVLAILLSTGEFLIGVGLLFSVRMILSTWSSVLFMALFTPLTFYLAVANPVSDCGCFGDALILTNWETFYKNIVILIPVLFMFFNRKKFPVRYNVISEWVLVGLFTILIFGTSWYSHNHLPIIDFRPYKVGTQIAESMTYPPDAEMDEYKIITTYEKDGVKREFVMPELPDSTWKWVNTESILVKAGYEPPIHDFFIQTLDGEDITDDVLSDEGYTFLLVSHDLEKCNTKYQDKINDLADYCEANDHRFICLTSSTYYIDDFINKTGAYYEFCNMDEIALKTMVRSNPGLILLQNGTIMSKMHYNDIPEIEDLDNNLLSYILNNFRQINSNLLISSLLLVLILVFCGFTLVNGWLLKKE